jgi:mono/diheme cytochrome c family protein
MNHLVLPLLILSIALGCSKSPVSSVGRSGSSAPLRQVKFFSSTSSKPFVLDQALLKKFNIRAQHILRADPNSQEKTAYLAVPFAEVVALASKQLGLNAKLVAVKFTALDGYVLQLPAEDVLAKGVFYVLQTPGLADHKIVNKALNVDFDWRPGYILLPSGESSNGSSSTSPYQVAEIELIDKQTQNPIISSTPTRHLRGATVFVKSCSKCHSHNGFGGFKAPEIQLVTIRHPKDENLKKVLRAPTQTLGRKIGMSAFSGTDEDLDALVKFLRTLETKN